MHSTSRNMLMMEPIGDPRAAHGFGGGRFGERYDPISALVTIGTAIGGGVAAAGGLAAVAGAVATVGMTLTVVGAVTGSKTLIKLGSVMALAGGVTSLVAGAGTVAETAVAADAAGATAANAGMQPMTNAAIQGAGSAAGAPLTDGLVSNALGAAPASSNLLASNVAPGLAASAPASSAFMGAADKVVSATAGGTGAAIAAPSVISPTAAAGVSGVSGVSGVTAPTINLADSRFLVDGTQRVIDNGGASGGFFGSVMDFAQTDGGGKVIAGALSGLGDQANADRQFALEQQRLNTDQSRYNTQINNMNSVPILTLNSAQRALPNQINQTPLQRSGVLYAGR